MACNCHEHECGHEHHHSHQHASKKEIILLFTKLGMSILFLLLGLFVRSGWTWLNILFYGISYLTIGYDVILESIKNIFKGEFFDENFLMTLATILAFVIKDYTEAVAVMIFYQVGEFFQHMAVEKSKKSIQSLFELNIEKAILYQNGQEKEIDLNQIQVQDILLVKPGEKIPVDGIVYQGHSSLNMASLTGESLPADVKPNDSVLSGSVNLNGVLQIQATKRYEESTTYKMKKMIEEASKKKAESEKFITKFSKIYTPIVILLAILIAFIPPLILGFNTYFNDYLYRGLTFMIISCPCALVISIPLSFFAGIGKSAKEGILVKSSQSLETLAKTTKIAFDKTGTITKGAFKVVKEESSNLSLFRKIIVCTEKKINHPIAQSIVEYYKNQKIDAIKIEEIKDIPGEGITATYQNEPIIIGNVKHLKAHQISCPEITATGTTIYVAYKSKYLGYLTLQDEVKETSKEAIQDLAKLGIEDTYLISGDKEEVAQDVAQKVHIKHVYSKMLPEDKVQVIQSLKRQEEIIVYAGDGINDAAVLLESDVGIAMGGLGSDLAIESADIVIMDDNLRKIPKGIQIAKKTLRIVKENIILALSIKVLVLIVGAFGFAPMWAAIVADVGVALLAILNALRVLSRRI
mgnify:CR=1 FL=1